MSATACFGATIGEYSAWNRVVRDAKIGLVTIELTRKHAMLFALLFAIQTVGLWVTFSRSPVLAGLSRSTWTYFFLMVPGFAFLTTVILMELLRVVLPKNRHI